jgi:N-methylhydantoinase B/oxoprolinase/acetone carboxylase alpha subunit
VAHQTDAGGRAPGSNASDSTELFAKGLRIPALKLPEGGQPSEMPFRIMVQNVRVPDRVLGDLGGEVAACSLAERVPRQLGGAGSLGRAAVLRPWQVPRSTGREREHCSREGEFDERRIPLCRL